MLYPVYCQSVNLVCIEHIDYAYAAREIFIMNLELQRGVLYEKVNAYYCIKIYCCGYKIVLTLQIWVMQNTLETLNRQIETYMKFLSPV